jgi:hypothetical protein
VQFVKCLPDGSTEAFSKTVSVERNETLSAALERTCKNLIANDEELLHFADTHTGLQMVISAGNGLHFAFPSSFFRSSAFNIIYSLLPNVIWCRYNNQAAKTDIYSILPEKESILLQGEHTLLCLGFVGIIGWTGYFSWGTTGLAGFSPFTWYPSG